MRVLLADSRPSVRLALRLVLEQQPAQFAVVGEVADIETLLRDIDVVRPDLILLEWELPGRIGTYGTRADVLRTLHTRVPGVIVIALSAGFESRKAALAAGADALVSKSDPPDTVLTTLETCFDRWNRARSVEN